MVKNRLRLPAAGIAAVLLLSGCGLFGTSFPTAEVGECLRMSDLEGNTNTSGEIEELPTVDCSEEHDAEVIHNFDLPDGDWPGDAAIDEAIERECLPAFDDYIGSDYWESSLDISIITPLPESWEAGDRQVTCIAFTMDGSTVTESFRDSGL